MAGAGAKLVHHDVRKARRELGIEMGSLSLRILRYTIHGVGNECDSRGRERRPTQRHPTISSHATARESCPGPPCRIRHRLLTAGGNRPGTPCRIRHRLISTSDSMRATCARSMAVNTTGSAHISCSIKARNAPSIGSDSASRSPFRTVHKYEQAFRSNDIFPRYCRRQTPGGQGTARRVAEDLWSLRPWSRLRGMT